MPDKKRGVFEMVRPDDVRHGVIGGPDVVESGDVGMRAERLVQQTLGFLRIVTAFQDLFDFTARRILGQRIAEAIDPLQMRLKPKMVAKQIKGPGRCSICAMKKPAVRPAE
jgi:hypothetical protein